MIRVKAQSLSQINILSQIGSSPDLLSQNMFTNQKEPEKGPSLSPSPELAKSGNPTLLMKKFKFSKATQDENENRPKEIIKRKIQAIDLLSSPTPKNKGQQNNLALGLDLELAKVRTHLKQALSAVKEDGKTAISAIIRQLDTSRSELGLLALALEREILLNQPKTNFPNKTSQDIHQKLDKILEKLEDPPIGSQKPHTPLIANANTLQGT